ncbi:MAG: metallophosphoesterase [Proteobacteria bacterium]|nr:metallophosphoesterase [Pseudomonadota bacterium]
MRCLLVADLHYALPQFDWLQKVAPRYDVVVLAGDALDLGSSVDFRAQIVVVRKYLQRVAGMTRLIVCSGNHDLDTRDRDGEKTARWISDLRSLDIVADGDCITLGDMQISVCPWWDGPVAQARLAAQLERDARTRAGRRWVWIHHAPPYATATSWSGSRSLGDIELVGQIAQHEPDLVFAGHIHQAPFRKDGGWTDRVNATWVFNAGHQYGAPPAHIALDTAAAEAVWISAMDVQCVRLDQPLVRPIPSAEALPDWLPRPAPADTAA